MKGIIFVLAVICIILIAYILCRKEPQKKPDGYIRINKSDPNKDTYTLELNIPFGELDERKRIIFEVVGDSSDE